jgi:hypothetical protein
VNAIIDSAYLSMQSKQWELVNLPVWRGRENVESVKSFREFDDQHLLVKEEKMPNGKTKLILRHKQSGDISERISD